MGNFYFFYRRGPDQAASALTGTDARPEFAKGVRGMATLADRAEAALMDILPGMAADAGTRHLEGLFHRVAVAIQAGDLAVRTLERVARLAVIEIPGFP